MFLIWCGSFFSMKSNEPGLSFNVRRPVLAVPLPDTTNSHCSALGCSFSGRSLEVWPGRRIMTAACTFVEESSGLKESHFFSVATCFTHYLFQVNERNPR